MVWTAFLKDCGIREDEQECRCSQGCGCFLPRDGPLSYNINDLDCFYILALIIFPSPADMETVPTTSKMTRYYKPMLYSAVATIYASLGFRIFRLSYMSHQLGKRRDM